MKSIQLILRGIKRTASLGNHKVALFSDKVKQPEQSEEPADQIEKVPKSTGESQPSDAQAKIQQWKMALKNKRENKARSDKTDTKSVNKANESREKDAFDGQSSPTDQKGIKSSENKTSKNFQVKVKSPLKKQVEQAKSEAEDELSKKPTPSQSQNDSQEKTQKQIESLSKWKTMMKGGDKKESVYGERDPSLVKRNEKGNTSQLKFDPNERNFQNKSAHSLKLNDRKPSLKGVSKKKKGTFSIAREEFILRAPKVFRYSNKVFLRTRKQVKKSATEETPRKSFFDHLKSEQETSPILTGEQAVATLGELIAQIKQLDFAGARKKLNSLRVSAERGLAIDLGFELRDEIKGLLNLPETEPGHIKFRSKFFAVVNELIANSKTEKFIPELLDKNVIVLNTFLLRQDKFTAQFADYVIAYGHTAPGYCIKVLDHFLSVKLKDSSVRNLAIALQHLTSNLVNMKLERAPGHEKHVADFLKIIQRTILAKDKDVAAINRNIPMEVIVISGVYLSSKPSFKENASYELTAESLTLLSSYYKRLSSNRISKFERVLMAFVEDKTFYDHIHLTKPHMLEKFNVKMKQTYGQVKDFLEVFSDRFVENLSKITVSTNIWQDSTFVKFVQGLPSRHRMAAIYLFAPVAERTRSPKFFEVFDKDLQIDSASCPLKQKIYYNKILRFLRNNPHRKLIVELEMNKKLFSELNGTDKKIVRILMSGFMNTKTASNYYSEYMLEDMARHVVTFKLKAYMMALARDHDDGQIDKAKLNEFIKKLEPSDLFRMLDPSSPEHQTLEYIEFLGGRFFSKMAKLSDGDRQVGALVQELSNASKENRPILFENIFDSDEDSESAFNFLNIHESMESSVGIGANDPKENQEVLESKYGKMVEIFKNYNKIIEEKQPDDEEGAMSCFGGMINEILDNVTLHRTTPFEEDHSENIRIESTIDTITADTFDDIVHDHIYRNPFRIVSKIHSNVLYQRASEKAQFFRSHKFYRIQCSEDPEDQAEFLRYVACGNSHSLAEKLAKLFFDFNLSSLHQLSQKYFEYTNTEVEDPVIRAKLQAEKTQKLINLNTKDFHADEVFLAKNACEHPSYNIALKHFKSQADADSVRYLNKQARLFNSYENRKLGF